MATYTLNDTEYESLRALALYGAEQSGKTREALQAFAVIEERADQQRFRLRIRWQSPTSSVPSGKFPAEWPPKQETSIEIRNRPINRADVLAAIRSAGGDTPPLILVTKDPEGLSGWQELDIAFPP